MRNHSGGRAGEQPAVRLAERLKELNLLQGRLKQALLLVLGW